MSDQSSPPDLKPCSNCAKPIEDYKLRLHEATCVRNTFKCPKCFLFFPKVDSEQHDLDYHTMVSSSSHYLFHLFSYRQPVLIAKTSNLRTT